MSTRRLYWEDSPFVQFIKENDGEEVLEEDQLIPKTKTGLAEFLKNNDDPIDSDDSERRKEMKKKIEEKKMSERIKEFFSVESLLKENFEKSYEEILSQIMARREIIHKGSLIFIILLLFLLFMIPSDFTSIVWSLLIIFGTILHFKIQSIKSKFDNIKFIIRFTHQNDSSYETMINKVFRYLREFELVWRGQRIGSRRLAKEIENQSIHKDKTMTDYCFLELRRNLKDNLLRLINSMNPQKSEVESDDNDKYNLYEIQKDFDGYLNIMEQKRVESRTILRKFSEGVIEIKKLADLGNEIKHILTAKARELKELEVSFMEIKNKMRPDENQITKFDVTMNYLQTMMNNYKTLKRNLQSIIKSELKEKSQLKSKIKYLYELEKTIFAENQLLHSKILDDIAIKRKKSAIEDGQENENNSSSQSESNSDQEDDSENSQSDEEYLKVYEADANDVDEPVMRRPFEEHEGESSARLFKPVLSELADTIKTRKIKHKAKHFKKAQDGKYREFQEASKEKNEKSSENEKKDGESADKQSYKIEKMDLGDFKLSMKDLFKELKMKKNDEGSLEG